jgi:hypothetical protein
MIAAALAAAKKVGKTCPEANYALFFPREFL